MRKITKEQFIEKARKVHGDDYIYTDVEYKNNSTKVKIICPIHGEFWQTPDKHINRGHGCPKCCKTGIRLTKDDFIEKARKIHGDDYIYENVEYINSWTKVCIICKKHGEFWQTPNSHLSGKGCKKCADERKTLNNTKTTEQFIEEARKVHGDDYDYSKSKYVNSKTKICIICKKHGEFWQTPNAHLSGKQGCPICKQSSLELKIIDLLNNNDISFETQKKFKWLGSKRLDYFIPSKNIAIECQGRQHFIPIDFFGGDKGLKETIERDTIKRQLCEEHGIRVLYFSNLHIDYPYEVIEDEKLLIQKILEE